MEHLHKCPVCDVYTLDETCYKGHATILPRPPKFSLEDKYAGYRREVRKKKFIEEELY